MGRHNRRISIAVKKKPEIAIIMSIILKVLVNAVKMTTKKGRLQSTLGRWSLLLLKSNMRMKWIIIRNHNRIAQEAFIPKIHTDINNFPIYTRNSQLENIVSIH